MPLFRRDGRPVELPASPHEHARTLGARKDAAGGRLAELRERIERLVDEHAACLLEGRFDDAEAAAEALESARAELPKAEAAHDALTAAELEVSKERQLADWRARVAECEATQQEIGDRIQQKIAELPLLVSAAQELASDLLVEESKLKAVAAEAHSLRWQIAHFGEPEAQVPPRGSFPSPVSAVFQWHPEYRSLANRTWHIGVAGPVPGPR